MKHIGCCITKALAANTILSGAGPRAIAINGSSCPPAVREVGFYGQGLNGLLSVVLGLLLLFLVRFNGLWFLWPLSILAAGVVGFGVLMAHSAVTHARESLKQSHPLRRFRVAQEIAFWLFSAVALTGFM
jgi:hypothetical protein